MVPDKSSFNRIMLKLSGEAIGGSDGRGIDPDTLRYVCEEIASVVSSGRQIAIVMGAGNFFRGITGVAEGMDQVVADQMGMVATVLNAMALKEGLGSLGVNSMVVSAIEVGMVARQYSPMEARWIVEKGQVALCAGGTGNPFFTTDTAAVLRALEIGCDVVLKSTKVDGIYDKDPVEHRDATRFERITYDEYLQKKLGVMDLTAITLARDNGLPVIVFDLKQKGALGRIASGEVELGTLMHAG